MKSKTAANKKINANFKKGGFVVYQTVVHLMKCVQAKKNATEESGRKLYLFVAFFLMNSIASNPPFLKLHLSLMRYAKFKYRHQFTSGAERLEKRAVRQHGMDKRWRKVEKFFAAEMIYSEIILRWYFTRLLESALHKDDETPSGSYCFRCKGVRIFEKVNSADAKNFFCARDYRFQCLGACTCLYRRG